MRIWIVSAVLMAVAAFTTACGSGDPQGSAGDLEWGETFPASLSITAGRPVSFTSSDEAATPRGEPGWRSVVVLRNDSPDPFPVSSLRVGATSGGRQAHEIVDPSHGCNGFSAATPVMPGQTVAVLGCWTGDGHRSMTFTLLDSLRSVTFAD